MTRPGLSLIAVALLLCTSPAWSEEPTQAPGAGSWAPGEGTEGMNAAAAATATAPAEVQAPAAATQATAAPAAATAATTPAPAASTATVSAVAPAVTAPAAASAAPAPAAAPAPEPALARPAAAVGTLPQRGMNMANVEHIFGTPLQKHDAVGKPPITRWDYPDYVVYFEYNMVVHTVLKSGPFSDSKASGG